VALFLRGKKSDLSGAFYTGPLFLPDVRFFYWSVFWSSRVVNMNRTTYKRSHPTTCAHYTSPFMCNAYQVCQYDSRTVDEPNFSTDGDVSHDAALLSQWKIFYKHIYSKLLQNYSLFKHIHWWAVHTVTDQLKLFPLEFRVFFCIHYSKNPSTA